MAADRVFLLDENTANRIAAGEVVERPASAVKELVENALDAGATQIVIALHEGGKERIVVADNGCGMTRADAILALQRHATSKIRSAEDLFDIRTLGFRGEALPSIAAVSRFTLTTKPPDEETGLCISVTGGDMETVEEVVARDGTSIEVASLFYNTPARLKFLKSTPTETSRTVEIVGHLAIAYPAVAFRLLSGAQEIFATPGSGAPLAALAAVWGREAARKLIPIHHESPGLNVTGYVATPDLTRTGRSHELFFVNRRPIKSRLLAHALEDAFRALTPDSRYPLAAVFVEINPELVDVNVHPTKTEVKFTRDPEVHHAVSQAIKTGLLEYGIVPTLRPEASVSPYQAPPSPQRSLNLPAAHAGAYGSTHPSPGEVAAAISAFAPRDPAELRAAAGEGIDSSAESPFPLAGAEKGTPPPDGEASGAETSDTAPIEEPPRPRPFAEQLRDFKVLGQARNTYIVALTRDGLAVIDQHVAHERVLYERLTVKRFSDGIPVQRLAVPTTLTLGRREALLLTEHLPAFAAAGWDLAPFGGESFVLRSVPAVLARGSYELVLRDMVDDLVNQTVSRRLLVQQDLVTITNACKMAVKAGDPLSIPEMEGLLAQLAETENPYLCPHGRPIVVTISFNDVDKLFKR